MRGKFTDQGGLFSYIAPDKRVPANHPLRKVRELVRDVLSDLNRGLGRLYASEGRPSIPPEQLLSALLLQVFWVVHIFFEQGIGLHDGGQRIAYLVRHSGRVKPKISAMSVRPTRSGPACTNLASGMAPVTF